ncbi:MULTISPECIES: DUF6517 family protein [Halolamina]|uniref:Uncharacterized protein n=1 Tax=Halolamina pelagica TaxID=699431 RepID=A0A1I5MM96_9EURY|nr:MULTISPECIES: DUF6517 family protein [Halolamina]NHX36066.1 hypothetical protein [Halolamina sp. R1-12]SFP10041.1 hypothetical protein SAMN05216277_101310 [Halolamina pelagica]
MELTRRAVGTLTVAGIAGLAGCSGSTSFSAEFAVTDTGDTGYERTGQREPTMSRTFAGQDVEITNTVTEYRKEIDLGPLGSSDVGVFAAFTSPQVGVAGQTFNPISNMSNKELAQRFQQRFDGMSDVSRESEEEVDVLGSTRTVTKLSATVTVDGNEVPVFLLIANFNHESDVVVPIGIFPQEREDEEGPNVRQLMANMTHPA